MGLFDWLTGGRRRFVQTSARRRRRRRGGAEAFAAELARFERLDAQTVASMERGRGRSARPPQNRSRSPEKRPTSSDDSPTVEIPKSVQRAAEAAWQRRQRAEREAKRHAERAERKAAEQRARDQARAQRHEASQVRRALQQREKAIEGYMRAGLTRAEAEEMIERDFDYEENPRRRRPGRRRRNPAWSAIAGEIAKDVVKGGLIAAAQEEAKQWRNRIKRGGVAYAVREEVKRPQFGGDTGDPHPRGRRPGRRRNPASWSTRDRPPAGMSRAEFERRLKLRPIGHGYYARQDVAGSGWTLVYPSGGTRSGLASKAEAERRAEAHRRVSRNPAPARRNPAPLCTVCGNPYQAGSYSAHTRTSAHAAGRAIDYTPPVRRNPARLEPDHADPRLREMSQRFHGRPDQILHLDEDQRRPPPVHVVKIGEERATVYRPPRGSERAGADWEHAAGDRGPLRRNASGRRILVADERGRVYLVHGDSPMRFDPDRGLVG